MDPLIDAHIRDFFQGHPIREHQWTEGPALQTLPNLRVLEIAPGPRMSGLTTYVTRGAWAATVEAPLEFLMLTGTPDARYVELLTMLAFYGIQHRLGIGHVIPYGGPMVPGSQWTYTYLSLPYTFGPELEILELAGGGHLHVLWAMPITTAERDLWRKVGSDKLEEAFEAEEVEYWNPFRLSLRAASAQA
jgi:hypothetical protein